MHAHLCEDSVLVDGAVLHAALARPDDLLVLLEAPVQEVHLASAQNRKGATKIGAFLEREGAQNRAGEGETMPNLEREGVAGLVLVKVGQVCVVNHGLKVHGQIHQLGQLRGQRCLTSTCAPHERNCTTIKQIKAGGGLKARNELNTLNGRGLPMMPEMLTKIFSVLRCWSSVKRDFFAIIVVCPFSRQKMINAKTSFG
jgi:hypothetical protein